MCYKLRDLSSISTISLPSLDLFPGNLFAKVRQLISMFQQAFPLPIAIIDDVDRGLMECVQCLPVFVLCVPAFCVCVLMFGIIGENVSKVRRLFPWWTHKIKSLFPIRRIINGWRQSSKWRRLLTSLGVFCRVFVLLICGRHFKNVQFSFWHNVRFKMIDFINIYWKVPQKLHTTPS